MRGAMSPPLPVCMAVSLAPLRERARVPARGRLSAVAESTPSLRPRVRRSSVGCSSSGRAPPQIPPRPSSPPNPSLSALVPRGSAPLPVMATSRVSFSVSISDASHALRADDAVHVCLALDPTGALDASRSIALVRMDDPAAAALSAAAPSGADSSAAAGGASSVWRSAKPLSVPWGVQLRYKYAVKSAGSEQLVWEKLSGDVRMLVPAGKVRARVGKEAAGGLVQTERRLRYAPRAPTSPPHPPTHPRHPSER